MPGPWGLLPGGDWGVPGTGGMPGPGGVVSAPRGGLGGVPSPRGVPSTGGMPGPGGGGGGAWSWGEVPGLGGHLVEIPPGTPTAAGGTHPTGMHSCCCLYL